MPDFLLYRLSGSLTEAIKIYCGKAYDKTPEFA
jgi:hypothetical protein